MLPVFTFLNKPMSKQLPNKGSLVRVLNGVLAPKFNVPILFIASVNANWPSCHKEATF